MRTSQQIFNELVQTIRAEQAEAIAGMFRGSRPNATPAPSTNGHTKPKRKYTRRLGMSQAQVCEGVLAVVAANPGIRSARIIRLVKCSRNAFVYASRRLRDSGKIVMSGERNTATYTLGVTE